MSKAVLRIRSSLAMPLLLAVAVLGACEGAGDPGVTQLNWTLEPYAVGNNLSWREIPKTTAVRVLDDAGAPVSGEELRLEVGTGAGILSPALVTTDADGVAAYTYTPLTENSEVDVYARATVKVGTVSWVASPRPSVSFEQDDVVIAQGCKAEFFARVLLPDGSLWTGETVLFERSNPAVASFYAVLGATGSTRGMRVGLQGEQGGETQLVATHASGVADTARVTVVAPPEGGSCTDS